LPGKTVHILITGMHMSEMDAFELLSLLGAKYPKTPVIVMTNNASSMLPNQNQADGVGHSLRSGVGHQHAHQTDLHRVADRLRRTDTGITLSSFLQMLELEGRSCTLQITAKGKDRDDLYSERQACSRQDGAVDRQACRAAHSHLGKRIDRHRLCPPGEITRRSTHR
jgi:CheY-like chemotaxis protein